MARTYAQRGSDIYVSVGFSASFPDRCLVTMAVPDFDVANQFMEASTAQRSTIGSFTPGGTTKVADLPPSVQHWNATTDADGNLVEGAP